MTNEIERLKAERRELDRKIRELEHADKNACIGRAKLQFKHWTGGAPDYWGISVKCIKVMSDGKRPAWNSIIQGETKEDMMAQMPEVIADLQALYEKIRGENNG